MEINLILGALCILTLINLITLRYLISVRDVLRDIAPSVKRLDIKINKSVKRKPQ